MRRSSLKMLIRLLALPVALLCLSAISIPVQAQSASFAGALVSVGTGFSQPLGVAVDGMGDVYVADSGHSQVVEIPVGGGAQSIAANGIGTPYGVAVNQSTLFVSANGICPQYGGGVAAMSLTEPAVADVCGPLNSPYGVATDSSNDLIEAVPGSNTVLTIHVGPGTFCPGVILDVTGFSQPYGVAVDSDCNTYVADTFNNQVWVYPSAGGSPIGLASSGQLSYPTAVAVDSSFDVFIVDAGNNRVVEFPYSANSLPFTSPDYPTTPAPLANGLNFGVSQSGPPPAPGIAVDGSGDLYFANTGANQVLEIQHGQIGTQPPPSVNFGSVNVCPPNQTNPAPCNQTQWLTFNLNLLPGTTLGNVLVVNQGVSQSNAPGAPTLDFTMASGSTCTSGLSAASTSCSVVVNFAPQAPGTRTGAVQLYDNQGDLLVTTMMYGQGQGPEVAISAAPNQLYSQSLATPWATAVDAAGDVYVADYSNNQVLEFPFQGGSPNPLVGPFVLNGPTGVAVDGAGDVFIADSGNQRVVEVFGGCTTYGNCPQTGLSGNYSLNYPSGVAVDAMGNVYVSDSGTPQVLQIPAGCGATCQNVTAVGGGNLSLSAPNGVAVDGTGDVFIADGGSNNQVLEVSLGCATGCPIASGLNNPNGVAVDAAGDVFIGDSGNQVVREVPLGCPSNACWITLNTGSYTFNTTQPLGVSVDALGDIFIADTGDGQLLELKDSQPPALGFPPTNIQTNSSPQSVTVQNVGNQPLNAFTPGLNIGANFVEVPGSGMLVDCSTSFALTPPTPALAEGAICNLSISFEPQSGGSLNASALFTDNALNAPSTAPANQTLGLTGTVLPNVQTGFPGTVTASTAVVNGTVNPAGQSGYVAFMYGTAPNYLAYQSCYFPPTTKTPICPSVNPLAGQQSFSKTLTGLTGGTTYYYRIVFDDTTANQIYQQNNLVYTFTTAPKAQVLVSPTSLPFGDQPEAIQSAPQTVTVTNNLATSVTVSGITITGTDSGDFSEKDNCTGSSPLQPMGGSCTINVTFTPQVASGKRAATLSITDSGSRSAQNVSLTGTAEPQVALSAKSLTFGGSSVTPNGLSVTLTNNLPTPLSLNNSVEITGSSYFNETDNCTSNSPLPSGGTCAINVTFNPQATTRQTATLTVTDSANNSPQTVSLTGNLPSLSFAEQVVDYSDKPSVITVFNSSLTTSLTINGVTFTGTDPDDFAAAGNCNGMVVPPSGECKFSVIFTPQAPGKRTATLNVNDTIGSSPAATQTISLSGTGKAQVTFSPTALDFSATKVYPSGLNVTLTNNLPTALSVNSGGITITGANANDFAETDNCAGNSVPSKGTCTITVTFNTQGAGAVGATLNVFDNATPNPQTVNLTGNPAVLNFSNELVNHSSAAKTVTVVNSLATPLSINSITVTGTDPDDFVPSMNCVGNVVAGGTCAISVTFTPAAAGPRGATLNVSDATGSSPQTVSLTGTGIN